MGARRTRAEGHLRPFSDQADRRAITPLEELLADAASHEPIPAYIQKRVLESAAADFAALWPAVKAEAKVGVKPLAYPLLTDENIHPKVALELRRQGKDVVTAIEVGLGGRPDTAVLVRATEEGRDGSSGHRTAARL